MSTMRVEHVCVDHACGACMYMSIMRVEHVYDAIVMMCNRCMMDVQSMHDMQSMHTVPLEGKTCIIMDSCLRCITAIVGSGSLDA